MREYSLDELGIIAGTDKSSLGVNYLRQYERIFAEFRDSSINIFEIGVLNGASLSMWRTYFTQAMIVGIDIHEGSRQFAGDRVEIEIGSQDDPGFLAAIVQRRTPTIVIDDGSHRADHMIFSFERLFPALAPGGCYVIEDFFGQQPQRLKDWIGTSKISADTYFGDVIRQRLLGWIDPAFDAGMPHYLLHHVERIEILNGALVIYKGSRILSQDLDNVLALAKRCKFSYSLTALSITWEHSLRNIPKALEVALIAAQQFPDEPWVHVRVSQLQEYLDDFEGALQSQLRAIELATHDQRDSFTKRRDFLHTKLG